MFSLDNSIEEEKEKELFEDYEMRSWEFTPRIYKILGAATLMNLFILFVFGQFNLFSTRGCDTPYVGMVCQVLDSAYVASTFLGQDNQWESKPYEKHELEDAEITYIDVSDQLQYPEGYFALANPPGDSEVVSSTSDLGGIPTTDPSNPLATLPSTSGEDLIAKAPELPKTNSKVGDQDAPDSPFSIGDEPSTKSNKPKKTPYFPPSKKGGNPMSNDSPGKLPGSGTVAGKDPKKDEQKPVQPTPSPSVDPSTAASEFTNTFNKKPLQDFADGVIAKVDEKDPKTKVDLKQTFTVVLDGVLTKEGKFDAKKTRFVKGDGQPEMVNVAKDAIEAIGDSSIFSYLQGLGVERINLTLIQDDKQISAIINSNLPNESKARTVSSGFNGLMAIAKINVKEPEVQDLMKALKFQPQGKSFIINFAMPKDQAHKIIDQKLQEARQKKLQPNSGEGDKGVAGKGD